MQSWVEMFEMMETALPILLVVLTAIVVISSAGGAWRFFASSRQPVLSVNSVIVGKRTEVSHRHDTETAVNRSDTKYYVTFEVESGDRLEFAVSGLEYGQCAEGDEGKLTFQGRRYQSFERVRKTQRTDVEEFRKYRSTL